MLGEMEDMAKGRRRSIFTLTSETASLVDMMMVKGTEGVRGAGCEKWHDVTRRENEKPNAKRG